MSETIQESQLRQRIRDFLRSGAVARVNYVFGSVRITPRMIENVALRLQEWSRIERPAHGHRPQAPHVHIRRIQPMSVQITTSLASHVDAEYDPAGNRLRLRSANVDSTDTGKAVVLHECVHAAQDVAHRSGQRAYPDECVSFLSEWVFYRTVNRIPVPTNALDVTAHNLSRMPYENPGYHFTQAEQNEMIQRVRDRYRPHGITSDTRYPYNGVSIR